MGALVSWVNHADGAGVVLSTDSEVLGVGALRTPQVVDVWRSSLWASSTINLRANLGAARDVRVIAIAAPRDGLLPSSGATVRVTASAVQEDDAEALDTGAVPLALAPLGVMVLALPAAVSARWVRLQCVGAGDPYLQLGRLWVGDALVTQRNAAYGLARSVTEHAAGAGSRASVSGVRYPARGARIRALSFSLDAVMPHEADTLEDAALAAGTEGQVLVQGDSSSARTAVLGRFVVPPAPVHSFADYFTADMRVEEDA